MTDQEKEKSLLELCLKQVKVLKEGGFNAGTESEKGSHEFYLFDDSPELFMHSFNYDAYIYLKDRGLINSKICSKCGFKPINEDYRFIRHNDNRIQTPICYQCWSERQVNIKNLAKASKCYIATICYESDVADEVILFRRFRDKILRKTIAGRLFISFYYYVAPPISNYLHNKQNINKAIIKFILNPIYNRLKTQNQCQ